MEYGTVNVSTKNMKYYGRKYFLQQRMAVFLNPFWGIMNANRKKIGWRRKRGKEKVSARMKENQSEEEGG